MQLTEHFSLEELIASETADRQGIDNTPSDAIIANLRRLAGELERVRGILGKPIHINSGYRCPALNAAVGGAKKSAHMEGLAADIIAPGFGTPVEVCNAIAASAVEFDQLIYEHSWCHFGLAVGTQRHELLTLDPATRTYRKGIIA